jgi:hypothetical protein
LLGALWDGVGLRLFGTAGVYGGHGGNFIVQAEIFHCARQRLHSSVDNSLPSLISAKQIQFG